MANGVLKSERHFQIDRVSDLVKVLIAHPNARIFVVAPSRRLNGGNSYMMFRPDVEDGSPFCWSPAKKQVSGASTQYYENMDKIWGTKEVWVEVPWYEEVPKHGVFCRATRHASKESQFVIISRAVWVAEEGSSISSLCYFDTNGDSWDDAVPIAQQGTS